MSCNCEQRNHPGCSSCEECMPIHVDNDAILFSTAPDFKTTFDNNIGAWTELTVNGCVTVPEVKPSIEAIYSIHTQIEVVRTKVVVAPTDAGAPVTNLENKISTGRKLIVEGLICSTISYVSSHRDQSHHTFHGKIPFSAYIVLPVEWYGTTTDVLDINFNVNGFVEDVMVKSACERNLCLCTTFILQPVVTLAPTCNNCIPDESGICCSLQGRCPCNSTLGTNCNSACDACEEPIIKGISTDAQINAILSNSNTTDLWTEIFVPEILNIPECKPNMEKIMSVTSKFEILCQKVIAVPTNATYDALNYENLQSTGRKLIVEGVLRQRITYISCTETKSVHSAHFDVPVSTFIVLPEDAKLTDKYRLTSVIEDIFVCGLNERQIFKNTTLFINASEVTCL